MFIVIKFYSIYLYAFIICSNNNQTYETAVNDRQCTVYCHSGYSSGDVHDIHMCITWEINGCDFVDIFNGDHY